MPSRIHSLLFCFLALGRVAARVPETGPPLASVYPACSVEDASCTVDYQYCCAVYDAANPDEQVGFCLNPDPADQIK